MPLVIATQNTKATLSDRVAARCLTRALEFDHHGNTLDVWCGQEWGPNRNDVLADHGLMHVAGRRNGIPFPRAHRQAGVMFVRHADGGPPMGLSPRFRPLDVEAVLLAHGRHVHRQEGTRPYLEDNYATLVTAEDRRTGRRVRLLDFHLEAHVEHDGRHRDPGDPRAIMHTQEWARIADLAPDYAAGDTNWHDLTIPGLVSCWRGRKPAGTLGNRAIDTVYAKGRRAAWVDVLGTPAREHKLVVAGYRHTQDGTR